MMPARLGFLLGGLLACAALSGTAQAASWKPLDPAELALAAPKIDKTADAEIILWDVRVFDEVRGDEVRSVYDHYMRVKIFTDRGREAFARVDIPHLGNVHVFNVQARTVKPDGSYVEIKGSDVFEREIVKANGVKLKAVSFPLPGLERGGIVEYRWRETHGGELLNYLRLPFSREYPVHQVTYHVKPLSLPGANIGMRALPFHGDFARPRREGEYFILSLANVPAFREEPHAPSEWEIRPWVLVYYRDRAETENPQQFWAKAGREFWDADRKVLGPTAAIRTAAREAVAGASTLDDRIARLLAAARTRIERTDINPASIGERKKRKDAKHAGEAFERGEGRGHDLVNVFIAMARAVDLDARPAYVPSRDDMPFDAALMQPYFLDYRIVAVRDGTNWRFLDPANHHDPAGHLRWTQEGQAALIPDEAALTASVTPETAPHWTLRKRTATLTLAEDGTLEGDARCEYHGHVGLALKGAEYALAEEERVKRTREQLLERLPGAEITNITIEHVSNRESPYTLSYHLRVPGYAQRTGSRLFLQPAVFQKGLRAEFSSPTRVNPIAFDYPWTEHDEVSIALPPGYAMESPDAPPPVALAGVGRSHVKLVRATDDSRLSFTRDFVFGEGGSVRFTTKSYGAVKDFFDGVQKQQEHALTLRKKEGGQ